MPVIPDEPCVIERWLALAVLEPLNPFCEHELLAEGRMAEQVLPRLGVIEIGSQQHGHNAAGSR